MDCIADFVRCFPQIAKYFKFTRTASQICEMFFLKSQNISNSQGLHRRFVRCFSSNRKIFQIHMDCIADLWDVFLKSQNISNSQGRHCFFDMCDCTHVHVLWCCLQVIMTALWISSRWLSLSSNNPSQLPRTPAWWADRYSFSSTIKLVWGLFYKHWRSQFDCKPDWQHQGAGRRRSTVQEQLVDIFNRDWDSQYSHDLDDAEQCMSRSWWHSQSITILSFTCFCLKYLVSDFQLQLLVNIFVFMWLEISCLG